MNKKRFGIIASVYLVLTQDNKTLLLLRKNTGFEDGNYGLVAGHVEDNETLKEAMIREAKEEAGIDIKVDNLELRNVLNRHEVSNERVDFFFSVNKWEGEIINNEPEKCGGLEWFDMGVLPENVIGYIWQALEDVKNKRFYREIVVEK